MREAVEAMAREKARLGKTSRLPKGNMSFGQFLLEWLDFGVRSGLGRHGK